MTAATDEVLEVSASGREVEERARVLFKHQRHAALSQVDRLFVYLMLAQWAFGILIAVTVSPFGWEGKVQTVHLHVQIALLLGGALSALPIALAIMRPGHALTRHVWPRTDAVVGAAHPPDGRPDRKTFHASARWVPRVLSGLAVL